MQPEAQLSPDKSQSCSHNWTFMSVSKSPISSTCQHSDPRLSPGDRQPERNHNHVETRPWWHLLSGLLSGPEPKEPPVDTKVCCMASCTLASVLCCCERTSLSENARKINECLISQQCKLSSWSSCISYIQRFELLKWVQIQLRYSWRAQQGGLSESPVMISMHWHLLGLRQKYKM